MRAGAVSVVIAYALDRLSRNQAHLYIIADEVEAASGRLKIEMEDFEDWAVGRFMRSARCSLPKSSARRSPSAPHAARAPASKPAIYYRTASRRSTTTGPRIATGW